MQTIDNFLEVDTLLLTWQSGHDRNKRYCVGEVSKEAEGYSFKYLTNTKDFEEAKSIGFAGFPAFKLSETTYRNDVLYSFRKRLPPKSRRDFSKFLAQHGLESFSGDDFQLICHTGVQLPSDGFDLIPNLEQATIPFEYFTELAGTRYHLSFDQVCELQLGTEVSLHCESENKYDGNAIATYLEGQKIGYINRLLCKPLKSLMRERDVSCKIVRKAGSVDRPLVYVLLTVR